MTASVWRAKNKLVQVFIQYSKPDDEDLQDQAYVPDF